MSSSTRFRYIFLVLIVITEPVSMQDDLLRSLNLFVSHLFAGFKLTSLYLISYGTYYPPINEDVTFWCVTPKNDTLVQIYVDDPDINLKLDIGCPVKFIIHGWLGGLNGGNRYLSLELEESDGWMRESAIRWADIENCNVCAVDWSRLSNYEYSVAALVNTDMAANYMIKFMSFLITQGMEVRLSAIAGHSLGAQIAGKVGRYYQGLLDAIYGMDPAGPGFTVPWDFGAGTRLSKKDAQYVQCIHTASGTLGTHKDCGHANFHINGGLSQPGCTSVLCSHSRSHDYFDEAMFAGHIFSGTKCYGRVINFVSTLLGMPCSMDSERLGIYAERKPGRYYATTNAKPPYATYIEGE